MESHPPHIITQGGQVQRKRDRDKKTKTEGQPDRQTNRKTEKQTGRDRME